MERIWVERANLNITPRESELTSSGCLVTRTSGQQPLCGKADDGRLRSSWCARKWQHLATPDQYREAWVVKLMRVSLPRRAFEMLERYAGKPARAVLWGGGGGNAASLPGAEMATNHNAPFRGVMQKTPE